MKFTIAGKLSKLNKTALDMRSTNVIIDVNKKDFGLKKLKFLLDDIRLDEIKGIPLMLTTPAGLKIVIKIIPVPIDPIEDNSYVEIQFLQKLTKFIILSNISPCITYYYDSKLHVNNSRKCFKAIKFNVIKKHLPIKNHSNILVCEYLPSRDIDNWVATRINKNKIITDDMWRCLIFQVMYTLLVLQCKYTFMHNDLHPGNILIDEDYSNIGYFKYTYNGESFYPKCYGFIPKIWDFEFAKTFDNEGDMMINNPISDTIYKEYNEFSDIHFFLKGLYEIQLPFETHNFIKSLYPEHLLTGDALDSSSTSTRNSTRSSHNDSGSHSSHSSTRSADKSKIFNSRNSLEIRNYKDIMPQSNHSSDHSSRYSSEWSTENSESDTTNESSIITDSGYAETEYLKYGKLKEFAVIDFNLPSVTGILNHKYFDSIKIKPNDIDILVPHFKYQSTHE